MNLPGKKNEVSEKLEKEIQEDSWQPPQPCSSSF
jgi:hypothetical protein